MCSTCRDGGSNLVDHRRSAWYPSARRPTSIRARFPEMEQTHALIYWRRRWRERASIWAARWLSSPVGSRQRSRASASFWDAQHNLIAVDAELRYRARVARGG